MGVVGPRVDLELGRDLSTKPILWQHASDRLANRVGGLAAERIAVRTTREAAGVTGVVVHHLVSGFAAGQRDLLCVDDDHVIAHVHVRSEGRLVLATKNTGNFGGHPAKGEIGGVDDVPRTFDLGCFRTVGFHLEPILRLMAKMTVLGCLSHLSGAVVGLNYGSRSAYGH
jgi:hypothetical protein